MTDAGGAGGPDVAAPGSRLAPLRLLENGAVVAILAAMVVLPVIEVFGRGTGLPSVILIVQNLVLWLSMLGAGLAAREGRHLAITQLAERLQGTPRTVAKVVAATVGGAVAALLFVGSIDYVKSLRVEDQLIGGLPVWVWALALPLGFGIVAIRLTVTRLDAGRVARIVAVVLVALVLAYLVPDEDRRTTLVVPGVAVLAAATAFGAPLFALLGGAAMLLFFRDYSPLAAVPLAAHELVTEPILASIPLFTLAGYVFADGGASRRLVRLFRAFFGWMPGGLAVAAAIVCAFFTSFTGGSGVTILALGGLLFPAMLQAGFRERYSLGLLTTSGSLGLLFPPSVPVILFVVVLADIDVSIKHLFAGAFFPGLLLLAAVAATGVWVAWRTGAGRAELSFAEIRGAMWESKWELFLPVLVIGGLFGGKTTPVEASALTALYAIVVESLIHRELSLRERLPETLVKTATLIGGVLTILCVAKGLTSAFVDAEIPMLAVEWAQANIETRFGFLLALNVFLLLVGCLMDIFSAIVVVVPIIKPMAEAYGVDPIHLGVIFIANLKLGYLTPPVGINLFLASFRFERPLLSIYRATIGFFVLLLVAVIAITYIPALTHAGVELFGLAPVEPGE